MSLERVFQASDLFGPAPKPAAPPRPRVIKAPKLDLAWGSFHQGIGSSIAAVLTWTRVPKNFLHGSFFKECWVERPSPRGEPAKPLPPEGADAFHPRQRIFTDPVHPTHPRQTVINSAAPPEPPKILPNLPNIVQLQQLAGPARPRLEISQETLSKLRPRELRKVKFTAEL